MLLRLPSSRLSVLSSSCKLRTISVTHANLLNILTLLLLASSGVVISFLPTDAFSSLSVNTLSSSCFSSFVISSTYNDSFIWYGTLSLNMLTTVTFLLESKFRIGQARSMLFSPTRSVIVMYIF